MANLFVPVEQTTANGQGSLAPIYAPPPGRPGSYAYINVTKDYPWTLSEAVRETAPRVILREFQINETQIRRQAAFYSAAAPYVPIAGAGAAIKAATNPALQRSFHSGKGLEVYKELYPKDKPTGFVYDMPYFSDINFEVNTPPWASLDSLEAVKGIASGIGKMLGGAAGSKAVESFIDIGGAATMAGLAGTYPKIGITDRPKLWNSHEPRTIQIKFPLFNTHSPDDWMRNRELCELLVNQNLYNKRDFITSIPPVFYELLIFGQHFSWASCVSNLTIYNRGNMRLVREGGKTYNVPDVYEINISLTDLVMPSKNMFQAINDNVVVTELVDPSLGFQGGETTGAVVGNAITTGAKIAGTTAVALGAGAAIAGGIRAATPLVQRALRRGR